MLEQGQSSGAMHLEQAAELLSEALRQLLADAGGVDGLRDLAAIDAVDHEVGIDGRQLHALEEIADLRGGSSHKDT